MQRTSIMRKTSMKKKPVKVDDSSKEENMIQHFQRLKLEGKFNNRTRGNSNDAFSVNSSAEIAHILHVVGRCLKRAFFSDSFVSIWYLDD